MAPTPIHPLHVSSPISHEIWNNKYRLKANDGTPIDDSVEGSWRRIANALAEAETDKAYWSEIFYDALSDFKFLPAGRITAGAGTARDVTLFNCFVMGTVPDDMGGIFDHLREAALTMQQGGGIGYDFSTLRPKGALVKGVGAEASGPLTFMDVWDAMCRTIMSAGVRRGAMMATMLCDHPDIEAFIEAKREANRLRMFNLSVLVTDAFMEAMKAGASWDLKFNGKVYKTVQARELWDKIMNATYAYAEPGVIFIDRINQKNNLNYVESIRATNPCGEQPLPPYGACLLGSINLTQFVYKPFTPEAYLDLEALANTVAIAVRMLDNAISVSRFPLEAQAKEAAAKRRQGLGITGLADALIMVGVRYGSDEAITLIDTWMRAFNRAAYTASAQLAAEKGAFPLFDADKFLSSGHAVTLDDDIKDLIRKDGIRNALLTSIAPTGTISLFAANVSSGGEPVFAFTYTRHVLQKDGSKKSEDVSDYAYRLFREMKGEDAPLPDYFVTTESLTPSDHIRVQAALQKHIDSSISKTVNVPEDISFEAFKDVYIQAYETGCKGCTTYRPNDITGSVLELKPKEPKPETEKAPTVQVLSGSPVRARHDVLSGQTYKVKWPESEHALYITINDSIEVDANGNEHRAPFEIFINSKNMEHFAWSIALTRMISAVFRRGGDVSFVAEELKAVFDPRGGGWMGGRYVPSLPAAIGDIVNRHLTDIAASAEAGALEEHAKVAVGGGSVVAISDTAAGRAAGSIPRGAQCPKCHQYTMKKEQGCETCLSCGHSKCS